MNMKLLPKVLAGAGAATLLIGATAMPANAAVTFDTSDGTGFVGKGDIQTAFGWNNADLQTHAPDVSFAWHEVIRYDATCQVQTGNPNQPQSIRTQEISTPVVTRVHTEITNDLRLKNQVTGFLLTGLGTPSTVVEVPNVGDPCNVGNNTGTYIDVTEPVSIGATMIATHDDVEVAIWPTGVE
jgi:hypothetical protein